MENILFFVALAAILVYVFAKLRFELHMMQLNSYRNERYFKWLKGNLLITNRVLEAIALVILEILLLTVSARVFCIVFILIFGLLAYLQFNKKQK